TLWIYRWRSGSGWSALDACAVDKDANTVTCTAPGFSTFALYGTAKPAGQGGGSGNNSGGGASGGSDGSGGSNTSSGGRRTGSGDPSQNPADQSGFGDQTDGSESGDTNARNNKRVIVTAISN